MSTDAALALERELRQAGIAAFVEPRDRLALLLGADAAALAEPSLRERVVALARAHGFTNVAVELDPSAASRAALPGD